MKKLFTLITLCLFTVMSAMAETTTLYERGTSAETAWADTDLADWTTQWNTLKIDGGLYSKAKNAGWLSTKTIAATKNSIVTFTATLYGGQAPGRSGSYDYIKVGGVSLRLNGQDQKATIDIDGVSTNLTGFTRGGDYTITATINQATGTVSYSVSGKATGSGTGTTNTAVADAVFGHNRAGSEGYEVISILKSISITEEKQEVTTANYTINYKFDGETINTVNGNTAVGNTVNAESPITIEDQKYYATGTTSMTVTDTEANNVLNVNLRKAGEWNWTVKSSVNTTLATGVCTEGGSFTVAIPRYINVDGTLYETAKGSDWYHKTYAITQDNQVETVTYNATSITNVVLYAEAEDLAGATSGNGNSSRTSMGLTGFGANLPVGALAPGKYKVYMHGANGNNDARAVSFNDGETALVEFSIVGKNNNQDFESEEFTIANPANVTLTSEGSSSSGVDYFYIVKTGEASMDITLNAEGFATFSAAFPAKIENANVWTAVIDGNKIVATKVENGLVPAGTGVLVSKSQDSAEGVKAVYDATAPASLDNNNLVATTNADGTLAEVQNKALVLSGSTFKTYTGATLAANKAYFEYAENLSKPMAIVYDGGATATDAIVEEQKELNGKFIQNGKLVIINGAKKTSVAGYEMK